VTFSPNASGNPRIDLIVCEHLYVDVQDGSQAEYSIYLGTPNANPVAPAITPNAQIKTIIGTVFVPAGVTDADDPGIIYTKPDVPRFSDDANIAMQNYANVFTALNTFLGIRETVKTCRLDHVGDIHPLYFFALNLGASGAGARDSRANNFILDQGDSTGGITGSDVRLRYITPADNIGGKTITIYTKQEFQIDFGYDILPSDGAATHCYIPADSIIMLKSVSNTNPVVADGNKWVLVNAQRASENRINSFTEENYFYGTVVNNSKTITINSSGIGSAFTSKDGNTMIVSAMAGSGDGQTQIKGLALLPVGTLITLEFTNTGVTIPHIVIRHNATAVTGTVLPILTRNGIDVSIKKGGSIQLRATSVGYVLVDTHNEKMYFDGYEILDNSAFNTGTKTITIPNTSNSFALNVPPGDFLRDIKIINDLGNTVDAPNGTIINIRFKYIGGSFPLPLSTPRTVALPTGLYASTTFYIDLENTSNIISMINDLNVGIPMFRTPAARTLSIIDDATFGTEGDVISFLKTDTKWQIINANREAIIGNVLDFKKVDKGLIWQNEASRTFAAGMAAGTVGVQRVRHCSHAIGIVIIEMNFLATANIPANTRIMDLIIQIPITTPGLFRRSMPFTMIQNTGASRTLGHMNFTASANNFIIGDVTSGKSMNVFNATAIPAGYAVQETFIITI